MLNAYELAELDLQNAATKGNGGWQRLLVGLQERVERATGERRSAAGTWSGSPATPSTLGAEDDWDG